jgi:hypothetical protein
MLGGPFRWVCEFVNGPSLSIEASRECRLAFFTRQPRWTPPSGRAEIESKWPWAVPCCRIGVSNFPFGDDASETMVNPIGPCVHDGFGSRRSRNNTSQKDLTNSRKGSIPSRNLSAQGRFFDDTGLNRCRWLFVFVDANYQWPDTVN